MSLRLIQVCNVGQMTGGTAACAWTVTRALPDAEHLVIVLSAISAEAKQVFGPVPLIRADRIDASLIERLHPDLIVLHNTPRSAVHTRPAAASLQYVHSAIAPAAADLTLYCSEWLACRCSAPSGRVLWQSVPRPLNTAAKPRPNRLRGSLTIGRLCTPTGRKWPSELVEFYGRLAGRFPQVGWEFVGCPRPLRAALLAVCGGETRFFEPSWQARQHFWRWDALLYHHPTLTESFGRTAAEAMRTGCIPIVDGRGGFAEQIPKTGGFLCRQEAEFAAAIETLLDPGVRLRQSRACRAYADERFSLARFADDLLSRFEQALSRHAGS